MSHGDDLGWRITVYVAGSTVTGGGTIEALRAMASRLELDVHFDVIDVIDDPAGAERGRVLATPTVVRESPLPRVRLVGDLSAPDHADHVEARLFHDD